MKLRGCMRFAVLAGAMVFLPSLVLAQSNGSFMFVNNLMPQPSSMTQGSGYLTLTSNFSAATPSFKDERLDQAIARALRQMEMATGLPLVKQVAATGSTAQLTLTVHGPDAPVQTLDEDESYSLTVTSSGVTIDAASVVGAMHGLRDDAATRPAKRQRAMLSLSSRSRTLRASVGAA